MFRRARWEGSRKLYFYLTCGSEPGNAAKYCRRLCEDIGLEYMGTGVAVMPENYLVMFPTPDSAEAAAIIERAEPGIEAGAREIAAGRPLADPKIGVVDRLRSGIVNDMFRTFYVKDRPFRVSDKCIGCGKCAKLCPVNDISLRGGRRLAGPLHALHGLHKRLPRAGNRIRPRLRRPPEELPHPRARAIR